MASDAPLRLEGKDWFREAEAAEYCGVSLTSFRESYAKLGISPKRAFGRKLYARADLYSAIAACPDWHTSTSPARQSVICRSGSSLDQLRPARQRPYVPRKKQSGP